MKKTRQLRLLSSVIFVLFIVFLISWTRYSSPKPAYRDLNKNGKMDVYEDKTQSIEKRRLGIPITIASDPRNHFSGNIFAMAATDFSQWCEPLGFAAIGDEKLMWQFADRVRQEYVATGIREALHPMADLATEPRWPR